MTLSTSALIRTVALSDYDIEVVITALNELSGAEHFSEEVRNAASKLIPCFEELPVPDWQE